MQVGIIQLSQATLMTPMLCSCSCTPLSIHHSKVYALSPSITQTPFTNELGILPRVRLGHIRRERIKAKALVTELDAFEVGVDLPWTLLRVALDGASEETTFPRKSAEALALCQFPAAGDCAFWHTG